MDADPSADGDEEEAEPDGEAEPDDDGEAEPDEEAEPDDDGDGDDDDDGEPEADGEEDADAEGEADGDFDADADADDEVEADGRPEGPTDGTGTAPGRLTNEDADGLCSVAACRERECRTGAEPPGPDADELEISGACDVESGSPAATAPACGCTCPAGNSWTAPVSVTTAAAQAATNPVAIHAGPRDRDHRRRECRPLPRPPPGDASPAATPAAGDTEGTEDTEGTARTAEVPTAPGTIALSSATSWLADGRPPGCLARQRPTRNRSSSGSPLTSAALLTSRYMSRALDPTPNGPCPQAAYTSTEPRLKMSLGGPTSCPKACSGDANPANANPAAANPEPSESSAPESPNPVTRAPSAASETFEGLRSRCTSPAS